MKLPGKFVPILLLVGLAGSFSACTAPRTSVKTDGQSGSIVFKVTPSAASVSVNGKALGKAREYDGTSQVLKVEPGTHVVAVSHPGYRDYQTRVYISDSQEVIQVELEKAE